MNGSANWYCISMSSRKVGFQTARAGGGAGDGREAVPRPAGLPVGDVDQLAGGAGVRVVRQVPHLPRGVGVLAQDGQAFADVGDVGVGVRLVGVTQHGGGASGQGGGEEPVAEVGLGTAAGPK